MSAQVSKWIGYCDACGAPSPEERETEDEALADADECPCRDVFDEDGA